MKACKGLAVLAWCMVGAGCGEEDPPGPLELTAISPPGARQVALSYSPDGERMSFWMPTTEGSGGWRLWMSNADLAASHPLPVSAAESPPPAVWSPDGTKLAALSNDFGSTDIVVVTSAGGAPRRLTDGGGMPTPLFWHPDGERFTYFNRTENGLFRTFAVSAETGATTRLLPGETRGHVAVASPDGSRIAYNVLGPDYTIWVADSTGENRRQLTTGGADFFPPWRNPWSPDGTEILYQSRPSGSFDLWVAPVDGTAPRQLTTNEGDDSRGAWSPDGKWIAFQSERDGRIDIWVVPAAGGTEYRVSDTPDDVYGSSLWRPGPSPTIAFVARGQRGCIWALNLDDGTERPLTPDSLDVEDFDLSSSGRELAFVISRDRDLRELASMPVTGGQIRSLASVQGTLEEPLWSPNDSMILFRSDRAGSPDVWVVDVADGSSRQVLDWPSRERRYAWTGPGDVVFTSDRDAAVSDLWRINPAGGVPVRVTTHGHAERPVARGGLDLIFVGVREPSSAGLTLARVLPDGSLQVMRDWGNASPRALSPTGAWVAAEVEPHDGLIHGILIPTGGGEAVLLGMGEEPVAWSPDGRSVLYTIRANAASDLAMLTMSDSTVHRLTTTPEAESRPAFTPDGSTVVFRRERTVQRIFTISLERVLRSGP